MMFCLSLIVFPWNRKTFFSSVATSKVICGLYGRTWFRFVCSRSGLTGSQWVLSYYRFCLGFFPSNGIFPSLLVTAFHSSYVFLPLTLVCNPFHGRSLSYNAITSIPSGALTGLTALNTLWGKGVVLHLCGSIVFSCILEFLHYCRFVCSHMGIFSVGPLWINITIFLPLILVSFLEILEKPSPLASS